MRLVILCCLLAVVLSAAEVPAVAWRSPKKSETQGTWSAANVMDYFRHTLRTLGIAARMMYPEKNKAHTMRTWSRNKRRNIVEIQRDLDTLGKVVDAIHPYALEGSSKLKILGNVPNMALMRGAMDYLVGKISDLVKTLENDVDGAKEALLNKMESRLKEAENH